MANAGRDEIRRKLSEKSHARGTPTPSAPGTPPARISGELEGSIGTTPPTGGGGTWTAYAGPRGVVYAAIQNFGGVAGRNHASHLPPRPYMDVSGAYARMADSTGTSFYRAVFGG